MTRASIFVTLSKRIAFTRSIYSASQMAAEDLLRSWMASI
jgi:hypothetical protein